MYRTNAMGRPTAFLLAIGLLSACATVDTKKVTSVVDPQRIDAVEELAVWKGQAETSAKVAPATCEPKYVAAQQRVKGWIEGSLTVQIDDAAAQYYGSVDLSKGRIPAEVSSAVGALQSCAGDVAERGIEDVGNAILNWAKQEAKGQRKQSADALKAQLKTYEWVDWSEARKGAPR